MLIRVRHGTIPSVRFGLIRHHLRVSKFVEDVQRAFGGVVEEHGLALVDSKDTEWYASVEWARGTIRLRVTDDRRDNITEVFVSKPADDGDLARRHVAV